MVKKNDFGNGVLGNGVLGNGLLQSETTLHTPSTAGCENYPLQPAAQGRRQGRLLFLMEMILASKMKR